MLRELSNSINLFLTERVTSPLAGVFILSWLAFNWKAPLVLFWGDGTMQDRISFVSENYLNDIHHNIFYPVYATLIILSIYPVLSIIPFYWWHLGVKRKTRIKQRIDGEALLTVDQSARIREELFRQRHEHRKQVEELSSEIDVLLTELTRCREKVGYDKKGKDAKAKEEKVAPPKPPVVPREPFEIKIESDFSDLTKTPTHILRDDVTRLLYLTGLQFSAPEEWNMAEDYKYRQMLGDIQQELHKREK